MSTVETVAERVEREAREQGVGTEPAATVLAQVARVLRSATPTQEVRRVAA